MLHRLSIATRLGVAACLFLAPVGYGLWIQGEAKNAAIATAHREAAGAAYLRGVDAVHSTLARSIVLRRPLDGGGLAQALIDLRSSHGAALETEALSLDAEELIRNKDRTPTKTAARKALKKLARQIANRSAIVLDEEIASYYLGDVFSQSLPDLRDQVTELRRLAEETAKNTDDAKRFDGALLSGRIEAVLTSIEDGIGIATSPQGDPTIKPSLDETFQPFEFMMGHAVSMMETGGGDPAMIGAVFDAIDRLSQAVNAHFVELVEARAERLRGEWVRIGAMGGGLSLLAFLAVVTLVRRGVIGPLRRMTAALVRLADGDISVEVPASRYDDEIGALAAAMRRFKETLEQSRALSSTVVRSTMQVSVATGQAAAAVAQVSDGAHGQMASVDRLRRSFLETREAMRAVAELTRTGQDRSRDSAERLEAGLADVAAMAAAVSEIAEMSSEINRVTVSIGKLAAHSNILSLNASIEASRAGEHGRGFSVVATAVGTLAQQTLGLAREIAELAQRSHDRIGRGLEVAEAVGLRMRQVSATIAETDTLARTIVDQVARQRQSVDGIETALLELSEISHANASAAEQITATMRALAAMADDTRLRAEQVTRSGDVENAA
jgi:methyl-accepting chemotaxis protein